jgi:hypothetical protein
VSDDEDERLDEELEKMEPVASVPPDLDQGLLVHLRWFLPRGIVAATILGIWEALDGASALRVGLAFVFSLFIGGVLSFAFHAFRRGQRRIAENEAAEREAVHASSKTSEPDEDDGRMKHEDAETRR